ncbi:GNAT family N-acetyltransferase [Fangia hongkongensis]|uniref:GNAT family N-acetyltransferase n=1 Tax=Fangia hongkongensis TaxID=270495 RepID=UPI00036ED4D6|nr:GNAT family N-acetyltransferase [Fangia hongkongensis]MBK2124217.1 GNAT family N-acetyltransferase [Fangia hongkongensis]
MCHYEICYQDVTISDERDRIDVDYVYHNLLLNTYWARNLPYSRFKKSIDNSLCYGIYLGLKQIGFARVVTDFSETASLWDVVIDHHYRGNGYGKLLVESAIKNPKLKDVFKWFLMTEDAFALYEKFGFTKESNPFVMTKIMPPTF